MSNLFKLPKHNYTDFYDQARFILTWRVSLVILYSLIIFTAVTAFLAPPYLLVIAISLLSIAGIVAVLKWSGKYDLAAKLFLILGILISSIGLFQIKDMIHIVDLIWYLSIVIFGYFVLGKNWGVFGLLCFAISLACYMLFMLDENLSHLAEASIFIKIFQAFNAILASFVLGYIMRHFIQTNKHAELQLQGVNTDLTEKKSIIENQNDLNTVMLKEIHHRVKNNLQIISSLLRLQSSDMKNEESKNHFTDSINRIATMALIHEKLYQTDLVTVDVQGYFEDLTTELKKTYPDNNVLLNVDLSIQIKELNLNTLVPLALLYNELFSNSVKHAFANINNGVIKVSLIKEGKDQLLFNYSDNGIWEESSRENSFGLEMIETFTEQLEGKFERTIEEGTSYQFQLKILA